MLLQNILLNNEPRISLWIVYDIVVYKNGNRGIYCELLNPYKPDQVKKQIFFENTALIMREAYQNLKKQL